MPMGHRLALSGLLAALVVLSGCAAAPPPRPAAPSTVDHAMAAAAARIAARLDTLVILDQGGPVPVHAGPMGPTAAGAHPRPIPRAHPLQVTTVTPPHPLAPAARLPSDAAARTVNRLALQTRIALHWQGRPWPLINKLARQMGYRVTLAPGMHPETWPSMEIASPNTSIETVLRLISNGLGHRADMRVDVATATIEMIRPSAGA